MSQGTDDDGVERSRQRSDTTFSAYFYAPKSRSAEIRRSIAMFCGVGLLVATYGLDLSAGFF